MAAPSRRRQVHQRIQQDPVWFVENLLREETWSKQREVLEAIRDEDRVAVASCHGVGKTWTAARVILWWLACHADSCAVVTTAPTWQQVAEVLWAEVHRAHAHAAKLGIPIGGRLLDTKLEISEDRFAIGLSPDPHRATNFQGFHAEHLLFVVDEASGVDERIFEAAEGFQTAAGAKMLMIGNPNEVSGTFYQAFHKMRAQWRRVQISAFDSPNFTGEPVSPELASRLPSPKWVEEKQAQWGEDSPIYQVRVKGEFPTLSDDTIIPMGPLDAAIARRNTLLHPADGLAWPRTLSVDVARFGSDETVFVLRDGNRARILEVYNGRDLMTTTGKILDYAKKYGRTTDLRIVVDDAGLGGGVTDRLREVIYEMGKPWDVDAFTGGANARSKADYKNRRAEAWHTLAKLLLADDAPESEVELPDDEDMRSDLLAPKYKVDSAGRIELEPKDKTKERLGRSPDRGDAVVMAFAPNLNAAKVFDSPW